MADSKETKSDSKSENATPERVTNTSTVNTAKETKSDAVAENFQTQIHEEIRSEQELGYRGEPADPTPNYHYTVAGVLDESAHVPEEFKTQTGVTVWPEDVVKANSKK